MVQMVREPASLLVHVLLLDAARGMNCFHLLAYSGHGDVKSVWPNRSVDDRLRFDCSKLDQWEIVFDHMERKGMLIHLVLTETENESYWQVQDGGTFAPSRKLYYREMIARFGHHLALQWNLGEEIGWSEKSASRFGPATTDAQRKAFCDFIRAVDPYDSPIVAHTLPEGNWTKIYTGLLGYPHFEGISGQFPLRPGGTKTAHETIVKWIDRSEQAGRKWVISDDEPGGDDLPLKFNARGGRRDTAGVRPGQARPGLCGVSAQWRNHRAGPHRLRRDLRNRLVQPDFRRRDPTGIGNDDRRRRTRIHPYPLSAS